MIIPGYNVEKYLTECLDAILNPSFADSKCDGSTDNSLKILQTCQGKDPRLKVFSRLYARPGYIHNLGLEPVAAPFLMFCAADDWYEPKICWRRINH